MWKFFIRTLILLIIGMSTSCDQLGQLNLSENTLNTQLAKLPPFHKNIGITSIIEAKITISDLHIQIGRNAADADKVLLSGKANINIDSLVGEQRVISQISIQALPSYDPSKGAIYLKDMQLVSYKTEPKNFEDIFSSLAPYLNTALQEYFNRHPVYVLDAHKGILERLARKSAKGLKVTPGFIVIPFF